MSEAVDKLTAFMFPQDTVLHADATVVLGMNRVEMPATKAAELHRSGQAGRLVLTGGWNAHLESTEADAMKRCLGQLSITATDHLLDRTSTNTLENLRNAHALLADSGLKVKTLNIVSIHYHARRAWLTAKKVFGEDVVVATCCYPSRHYAGQFWHTHETGRSHVRGELQKIQTYFPDICLAAQQGWLDEVLSTISS